MMLDPNSQELYEKIVEIHKQTGKPVTLTKVYTELGWRMDRFKKSVKYLEETGFIKKTDVFQKYVPLKFEKPKQKRVNGWKEWRKNMEKR